MFNHVFAVGAALSLRNTFPENKEPMPAYTVDYAYPLRAHRYFRRQCRLESLYVYIPLLLLETTWLHNSCVRRDLFVRHEPDMRIFPKLKRPCLVPPARARAVHHGRDCAIEYRQWPEPRKCRGCPSQSHIRAHQLERWTPSAGT